MSPCRGIRRLHHDSRVSGPCVLVTLAVVLLYGVIYIFHPAMYVSSLSKTVPIQVRSWDKNKGSVELWTRATIEKFITRRSPLDIVSKNLLPVTNSSLPVTTINAINVTVTPKLVPQKNTSVKQLKTKVAVPGQDCGDFKFRTSNPVFKFFKPSLVGRDLCCILAITDAFVKAMRKADIPYFMYGGTLIGSWRHHDLIPWDDDMDFAVPYSLRQSVYRVLKDVGHPFALNVRQKKRWKFFERTGHPIRRVTWKYPFLDINFYRENSTHVWDFDEHYFSNFIYPKDWIFPLKLRPFHGRMLMSPQHPKQVLDLNYNIQECSIGKYNHRDERGRSKSRLKSVPCQRLSQAFPYVQRTPTNKGCNETLMYRGRVLNHFIDQDQCSVQWL